MSSATGLLNNEEIARLEREIESLQQELADLDRGVYHMRLDNGMTLQVNVTGDELRFDEDAILSALGLSRRAGGTSTPSTIPIPSPDVAKGWLPYALIGAGGVILLIILIIIVINLTGGKQQQGEGQQARAVIPTATATPTGTPTPTITPTPTATPTPTPPLIPAGFIARAPALLRVPSLNGEWRVYKGEWTINNGQIILSEEGGEVRYYDSFVGVSNVIIGGDGSTPESPLYLLQSADINDVIVVIDRANRAFYFRLTPFGDGRVERYIRPDEVWVAGRTETPTLTLVIRAGNDKRMVLRGKLYRTDFGN